ncbi:MULTISPECIES: hypothetical protein [unclassified Sporosarcina]|nr:MULTISPECIES: hypothetical protein [unclassified Sporosarcina]
MANKEASIATLSAEDLHALNHLEEKLGVTLVAYENVNSSNTK